MRTAILLAYAYAATAGATPSIIPPLEPPKTPCGWVLDLRDLRLPPEDVAAAVVAEADRFSRDDLRCLEQNRVDPALWPIDGQQPSAASNTKPEPRTALCDWTIAEYHRLRPEEARDAIKARSDEFGGRDIRCLRANRLPASIIRASTTARRARQAAALEAAAEALVATVDAVEAQAAQAESRPMDLWVLVRNPMDLARAERGAMADVGAFVMGDDYIASMVYDEVVRQTAENFRAEGVPVRVDHGVREMPTTRAASWVNGTRRTHPLSGGSYRLMRITVLDPIGLARQEKGDFMVGAGILAGRDIDAEVRAAVEQRVFERLAANGADSWILPN